MDLVSTVPGAHICNKSNYYYYITSSLKIPKEISVQSQPLVKTLPKSCIQFSAQSLP